jgi:hypothetical protein
MGPAIILPADASSNFLAHFVLCLRIEFATGVITMDHRIVACWWDRTWSNNYDNQSDNQYISMLRWICSCGLHGHYYFRRSRSNYEESGHFWSARRCDHARGQIGCVSDIMISNPHPYILDCVAYGEPSRAFSRPRLI